MLAKNASDVTCAAPYFKDSFSFRTDGGESIPPEREDEIVTVVEARDGTILHVASGVKPFSFD